MARTGGCGIDYCDDGGKYPLANFLEQARRCLAFTWCQLASQCEVDNRGVGVRLVDGSTRRASSALQEPATNLPLVWRIGDVLIHPRTAETITTGELKEGIADCRPPLRLVAPGVAYRTSKRQWRIGGTVTASGELRPNRVTVTFGGQQIGSSPVDATGTWDVRRTLFDSEAALEPAVGAVVHATSEGGGADDAPVNVRN